MDVETRKASHMIVKGCARVAVQSQIVMQSVRDLREKFRESVEGTELEKECKYQLRRLYAASRGMLKEVKGLVGKTRGLSDGADRDLEEWLKECGVIEEDLAEAERKVINT